MSENFRPPSVPLITVDPYFSIWSPADKLTDTPTEAWTGAKKPLNGQITIDSKKYTFLGTDGKKKMKQKSLEITATASKYTFEEAGVLLEVIFRTPLLLFDLELMSRPCSYVDFCVIATDGKNHDICIEFNADKSHCFDNEEKKMLYGNIDTEVHNTVWMGRAKQAPLSNSGDAITIDWGFMYISTPTEQNSTLGTKENCNVTIKMIAKADETSSSYLVVSYDDIASISYFGEIIKGYWATDGKNIYDVIELAIDEHDMIVKKCELFDEQLHDDCVLVGGEEYAKICELSYRQSIAAHKLIEDKNNEVVFLSKECFSNGCIGTVDVSYPSIPLYLIYNPELVRGMMRPIFNFARMDVWKYDFAPHDVGRYPHVHGQVYALERDSDKSKIDGRHSDNDEVFPMFHQYPANSNIYDSRYQMPVEECGNMLIMCAAVIKADGDVDFVLENIDILEKWVCYLLKYGKDPAEQLCTDDFAGHLAHNVNLAAKAIMGIASYAYILESAGEQYFEESNSYYKKAKKLAQEWEISCLADDHTSLTFVDKSTWSIKYNTIWDLVFGTELFSKEFFNKEVKYYQKVQKTYGLPLDSRNNDAKSDWVLWCAAMADEKKDKEAIIAPIYKYANETSSRVPFSDWYDTETGIFRNFKHRTVQGGIFMPLLRSKLEF